jgi:hypothetical protein
VDRPEYDVFVSHASEDKDEIARPIAAHLQAMGYRVWFDEFELRVGDSLSDKINKGLTGSRFGIVVLSKRFFAKKWTTYELAGLTALEIAREGKAILPVWHGVTHAEVADYSPTLADKVAAVTTLGLEGVCRKLAEALGVPSGAAQPLGSSARARRSDRGNATEELVLDSATWTAMIEKERCPKCGQSGHIYGFDGSDGDELDWFECNACGYFHTLHSVPSGWPSV